jgi:tetratricopeptide (TPR) repeat protein
VECPAANTWQRFLGADAGERAALEQHLDTCAECRLIYAEMVGDRAAPKVLPRAAQLGRYVVLDVIGRGGMGIVYKAFDPGLDRAIAVKLVSIADARERLVEEAKMLAKLSHPNVVAVHDVGTIGGDVFVAMELVAGVTLRRWLEQKRSPREILDVFVQAARGLSAAHRLSIVHRDFKPDNVMVEDDGRARVLDFGLARPLGAKGMGGTPQYMAPEQERGEVADARGDQYSFCVALYEALCGERPARDVSAVPARVPGRVRRALLVGLRRDPKARHASMDALIAQLADRKRTRYAIAALGVTTVAAGGVALWLATHAPPTIDQACARAADDVARVWNPARRAELVARTSEANAKRVDAWTATWTARRTELCAQAMKSDRDATQDIAQQVECLRRRITSLDASVSVIVHTKIPELVRETDDIITRAGAPTTCDSYERGTLDDTTRVRWAPVLEAIITAQVAVHAGRIDEAESAALAAVAAARGQPEPELLAGALAAHGLVLVERDRFADARVALLEAIKLATQANEHRIIVDAWLAMMLMALRGEDKDVDTAIFSAELAASKLASDDFARCMVAARVGIVHARRNEHELAIQKLEYSIACASELSATANAGAIADASYALGLVRAKRGEWDAAKRLIESALPVWEAERVEHGDLAIALETLGSIALIQDDDALAAKHWLRALEVARALRDDEAAGKLAGHYSYVLIRLQRCTDAAPYLEASRAYKLAKHGEGSPEHAGVMLGEAMCSIDGDPRRALATITAAKKILDVAPPGRANAAQIAITDFTLARALVATRGDKRRALALANGARERLANHPIAAERRAIEVWLAKVK